MSTLTPSPASVGGTAVLGARSAQMVQQLETMVLGGEYPCLGAKSAFARRSAHIELVDRLADPDSSRLYEALADYAATIAQKVDDTTSVSFVAAFHGPNVSSKAEFEDLFWQQLRLLHALDAADDEEWDPPLSPGPTDPDLLFSIGGVNLFVIGMHPRASGIARRTPWPVLVFNLHRQFEALQSSGRSDWMRDTIRRRDVRPQGSTNPMVADHGPVSGGASGAARLAAPMLTTHQEPGNSPT